MDPGASGDGLVVSTFGKDNSFVSGTGAVCVWSDSGEVSGSVILASSCGRARREGG